MHSWGRRILPVIGCLLLSAATARGFNPPVDQQGPLAVRISGPEVIEHTGQAYLVQVVLSSEADQPISGQLRLDGVDRWQCRPSEPVAFRVEANAERTYDFQITAGEGTYAALYPLHARASFVWQGETLEAHPVLIVESKVTPPKVTSEAIAWTPFPVSVDQQLAVWQLPVRKMVITVRDRAAEVMPLGWSGSHPENHGSLHPQSMTLAGDTRNTLGIHPPWHGGQIGTAWVEYPLSLPDAESIRLQFANAVTPSGEGDGVTFRVRVAPIDAAPGAAGEIAYERHTNAKEWDAGEADLSRFAGQSIRLQLESHPGPKNNTAFDMSYWAEPTLVVGSPQSPLEFPPNSTDDALTLGRLSLPSGQYDVLLRLGRRGLLDADLAFASGNQQLWFRGFEVTVQGLRLDDPGSPITLTEIQQQTDDAGGVAVRHRFAGVQGSFDLMGQLRLVDNTVKARFHLENQPKPRPWQVTRIEQISLGAFSDQAVRVYAGHGNVLQEPAAFELSFDGHRMATSHVGFDFRGGLSLLQAVDGPPDRLAVNPTARHYSLEATGEVIYTLIPGSSVWEAAKQYRETNGLKASAGVPKLAGRFVFDLWGGRYGESSDQLQQAFRYGLTDSAVVWHNWQRWGYDYRLPEIYPPNPKLGTEDQLKAMIDACRESGVLFALHDNYIDIYPDAEGFSYEQAVAFHEGGTPVKAWFNEGRQAQSYRIRSDQVAPFLQNNLRAIQTNLAPTAYFIDVWSSIKPYDYWTSDGQFYNRCYSRDSWGEHFAWIRDVLGDDAPQISESGHDQLIGWLDGAQTNHLRVGKPIPGDKSWSLWNIECQDAERIAWFDFAHHDRFALHGAGYSSRYQAGLSAGLHGIYSDDYMATEVLTGHPAMVSRPFGRDVVRKYWLTHDVMRSLAMRTIESIEFADGDLHRQHVRWSGKADVWVNRGESDWNVNGITLPQYGFLVRTPDERGATIAGVYRHQGLIVERSQSPEALYVNARSVVGDLQRIRAAVSSATATNPRRMDFVIQWDVKDPIPDGYRPFLHLVDAEGEIAFQAGYDAKTWESFEVGQLALPATAYIPEKCQAGESFELRVGLYRPSGGARLTLLGNGDDERRIRLGTLQLVGEGATLTGLQWNELAPEVEPMLARQNPEARLVEFGWVVTATGCRLTRDGDNVALTPLPREYSTTSSWRLRWDRLPWQLPKPTQIVAIDEQGRVLSKQPVSEPLEIEHNSNAFAYRLEH